MCSYKAAPEVLLGVLSQVFGTSKCASSKVKLLLMVLYEAILRMQTSLA